MADDFLFMWIVLSFTVLFQATDRFLKLKNLRINGVMHRSKGCLNGENYSLSFLLSILYYVNNKRKLLISFHSQPFQLYILIWNRHGHECSGIWKLSANFMLIQCIKIVSRFVVPRYIGDDFFLGSNLVSFNRTLVPYEISKVNLRTEFFFLVSISEEN